MPANEPNRIEIVGFHPYNGNLELVQREFTLGPANGLTLASAHTMSAVDLIGPQTGRNRQLGTDRRLAVRGGYHPHRGMVRGDLSWWTVQQGRAEPQSQTVAWFAVHRQGMLAAKGTIGGADDAFARGFASIAVTPSGDFLIGYSRFAATAFASAAYAWHSSSDPANQIRGERVFASGQAAYDSEYCSSFGCRWGDYSATALDPLDPNTLWTFQQFAAIPLVSGGRYGIAVAAIRPPCGDVDCGPRQSCKAIQCVTVANGTACIDGSACTLGDACHNGSCVGLPKLCTSVACLAPAGCDAVTGGCLLKATNDGAACTDGNACTSGDTCKGGGCIGARLYCSDPDSCHVADCDPDTGNCVFFSITDAPVCRRATGSEVADCTSSTGGQGRWLALLLFAAFSGVCWRRR